MRELICFSLDIHDLIIEPLLNHVQACDNQLLDFDCNEGTCHVREDSSKLDLDKLILSCYKIFFYLMYHYLGLLVYVYDYIMHVWYAVSL